MHLNRYALRTIRQRSGLTVSGLARRAAISQPHLSNVERGRRQASPELIVRLAAALRVPLVALLAHVDEHEPGSDAEADGEPEPGRPVRPGQPSGAGRPSHDVAGVT